MSNHALWAPVRRILRHDWNPIDIQLLPEDEYDGFVGPVISKLQTGATLQDMVAYLTWAADEHIECPMPANRAVAVAESLLALKAVEPS